ncbi:MAG: hypothetical protein EBQ64_04435, partial [Acidimicrobiia bacterium]|nr:hypothetical protein [Acidimicrobiia bacterium]
APKSSQKNETTQSSQAALARITQSSQLMESTSLGVSKFPDVGLLVAVIEGKFCTNFAPFYRCVADVVLRLQHCPKPVA